MNNEPSALRISIWYNVGAWEYYVRTLDAEGLTAEGSRGSLMHTCRDTSLRALRRSLARYWPVLRNPHDCWPVLPQAARHDEAWVASEEGDGWEYSIAHGRYGPADAPSVARLSRAPSAIQPGETK